MLGSKWNNDIIGRHGSDHNWEHGILAYHFGLIDSTDLLQQRNLKQSRINGDGWLAILEPHWGTFRSKWADKCPRPRLGKGP